MGSQFVLHDDEVVPSKLASVFDVEQPVSGGKRNKSFLQRVQRPTADALSGEDQVAGDVLAVSVVAYAMLLSFQLEHLDCRYPTTQSLCWNTRDGYSLH